MNVPPGPGHVFYLTNAAGQPSTWVTYSGRALIPGHVRVKIHDMGAEITVLRNRLQNIPNYPQVDPAVYLEQGALPHPPPEPLHGWAPVGGRRKTRKRSLKKMRLKSSRKSKVVGK